MEAGQGSGEIWLFFFSPLCSPGRAEGAGGTLQTPMFQMALGPLSGCAWWEQQDAATKHCPGELPTAWAAWRLQGRPRNAALLLVVGLFGPTVSTAVLASHPFSFWVLQHAGPFCGKQDVLVLHLWCFTPWITRSAQGQC